MVGCTFDKIYLNIYKKLLENKNYDKYNFSQGISDYPPLI